MKATLRLVGVELSRAIFKREPYVTALAVCQKTSGPVPLSVLPRTPAAGEEPTPVSEGATTTVTKPAPGIDRSHPLVLDVVLFDGDPGDWLVCHGAIMESDGGFRKAGARLDLARHSVDGTALGRALVAGLGAPAVAATLAAEAASVVAQLLSTNGDDVLCGFEIRLNGVAEYRKQPAEFTVVSRGCTARFTWAVEGLPEEVTAPAPPARQVLTPTPAIGEGEGRMALSTIVEKLRPPADEPEASVAIPPDEIVPEGQEVKPRQLAPGEVLRSPRKLPAGGGA